MAPAIFAPFLRHWKEGVGEPEATTAREALDPATIVCVDDGWLVIFGASFEGAGGGGGGGATTTGSVTLRAAALLVTEPAELLATTE